MIIRNHESEPIKENPHNIAVKQLYNDPTAQIMHLTLKPGETLLQHKTPVDVVFYVLEGNPTVIVGEESKQVERDNLVESRANILHYIKNETQHDARVLVIKAPRPEKQTKII